MTFKDIKNISDDEFIKYFKKYLPKDKIDQIYNKKLSKINKKVFIYSTITLGTLMDIISVEMLEALLNENISEEFMLGILSGTMILSYIIISKLKNIEFNKKEDKFNEILIDIKTNICDFSEEEFNTLVFMHENIINDKIDCNISSNVLKVINKLLSINAIDILKDFEIQNNLFELSNYYEDNCYILEKNIKNKLK